MEGLLLTAPTHLVFTESAHCAHLKIFKSYPTHFLLNHTKKIPPIFSHSVAMSLLFVCLSVCSIAKHPLPGVVETSGQRT